MTKVRIAPRLDVKGTNVVKGVHLEGLRIVGDPGEMAYEYYRQGADELIYIDTVASLYGRGNLLDIVDDATEEIFVPMTVGGGVRRPEDVREFLSVGADKVAINTAATERPELISDAAKRFGSQCIVGSIQTKRMPDGTHECFAENGREPTGLEVVEWARRLEELGAGEILLTSIDQDGTRKGYDVQLLERITSVLSVPVVACGGAGSVDHVEDCIRSGRADAVGIASMLHYDELTLPELKTGLSERGIEVRRVGD